MEAGIVGLPNVGKSTLFNALTASKNAQSANFPFCTIEPNIGIVPVPDERLQRIIKYIPPQKLVPASLRLVDIAGIVEGASKGLGKGNAFLSNIRQVDAILQVVRCFDDPDIIHVAGKVDPLSDIETVELELLFADQQSIDTALPKAERAAKGGDKAALLRAETLKKCQAHLAKNEPLRKLTLDVNEKKAVQSDGFLSMKPILYVTNVDEADIMGQGPMVQAVRDYAKSVGAEVVPVCAKLEAELAELDPADRKEMLEASGLKEPALNILVKSAYRALGLQSYFTAGEKEVRAWTVPVGATAPQAAGVIHTDFEKGFIRMEVYGLAELEQYKTEKEIKAAGKLRVEGKGYIMQDGDICHFLFN
ncbi:MAG: redox-regulated ATPase YchF [Fimbriiglobus sp.]